MKSLSGNKSKAKDMTEERKETTLNEKKKGGVIVLSEKKEEEKKVVQKSEEEIYQSTKDMVKKFVSSPVGKFLPSQDEFSSKLFNTTKKKYFYHFHSDLMKFRFDGKSAGNATLVSCFVNNHHELVNLLRERNEDVTGIRGDIGEEEYNRTYYLFPRININKKIFFNGERLPAYEVMGSSKADRMHGDAICIVSFTKKVNKDGDKILYVHIEVVEADLFGYDPDVEIVREETTNEDGVDSRLNELEF